ncbi:MAG: EF-Tu/IF-2/RF-3 family GTPase [Candidatus Omnitrophota bacterium]
MGKVLSGSIRTGQNVIAMPPGDKTRISFIKIFGRNKKIARAGENIGVILKDHPVAQRGQIIAESNNCPEPIYRFKSNVIWVSDKALKLNKPFLLRFIAQESECLAEKIEKRIELTTLKILKRRTGELKVNQAVGVVFKTKKTLVIENFSFIGELGRFVIEHRNNLCGVGIINDPKLEI